MWLKSVWWVTVLLSVIGNNSHVCANSDFKYDTDLASTNCSYSFRSTLLQCNARNVTLEDVDEYFQRIDMYILELMERSVNDIEDGIEDADANCTDIESRKKKDSFFSLSAGRKHVLDIVKLFKKLYTKNMSTLLIAYKLKFFTLFPLLVAGLMVIVKTSGMAGFFFALFIGSVVLKSFHH